MAERLSQDLSRASLAAAVGGAPATCGIEVPWDSVYDELRSMAARQMARLGPGQTLQPTALVNEAYMRLAAGRPDRGWESRAHFFGSAARAMRNILVDHARARGRQRRGGGCRRVPMSRISLVSEPRPLDLLVLDEALVRLEGFDGRMHEVVMLRFFAGFTIPEAARLLGVSTATVERDWSFARAWLLREVRGISASSTTSGPVGSADVAQEEDRPAGRNDAGGGRPAST